MPKINPHIFRAYDIRGIADNSHLEDEPNEPEPDLTEESVHLIGKATATHLIRKYDSKHMAVGRDIRLTSPALQKAFIDGLLECGLNVTDIGLAPSPMVYFAVCSPELDFDCGTNITASHNPKEYNGIKTVANPRPRSESGGVNSPLPLKQAHSVCGPELQLIRELTETGDFHKPKTEGTEQGQDIWPQYAKELAEQIQPLGKPIKVVIDAGNGVAGPFAPELLRKIGAEVIELYCDPDGTFPNHEANPEELHNMTDLIKKVRETKADLGIGFDGDGDRIGIIDEKGNHYSADYFTLLLTEDLVTRHKDPNNKPKVVTDVKFSQAIINRMKALGAEPIMCKVGHSFIEEKVKETGALLGGEVSGHLYFAENYYGFDDALLASAKILNILSNQPKPFSQLFDNLPKTYMTPEFKAHCPDDKKFEIVKQLVAHFTKNYDCITLDGVRVVFNETDWGAVRASNTSPNLTLRFEALTEESLAKIQATFIEELKRHPEVDLSWYKS